MSPQFGFGPWGSVSSNRVGTWIVPRADVRRAKVEKAKKAEVVEDLSGVFAKAGSVVVAHYSGMTVAQMSDLRARIDRKSVV